MDKPKAVRDRLCETSNFSPGLLGQYNLDQSWLSLACTMDILTYVRSTPYVTVFWNCTLPEVRGSTAHTICPPPSNDLIGNLHVTGLPVHDGGPKIDHARCPGFAHHHTRGPHLPSAHRNSLISVRSMHTYVVYNSESLTCGRTSSCY